MGKKVIFFRVLALAITCGVLFAKDPVSLVMDGSERKTLRSENGMQHS